MKTIAITFGTILAVCSVLPAAAKEAGTLPDCVSLSSAHQGTRGAEAKQLLLKDGDEHYRVAFNGSCQAMARSSKVQVQTNGQANLLCPTGSSVHAANRSCDVHSVDLIDATAYERQARLNRSR
ncbi:MULTISPECIES: hypothetical protein [unclassified Luteimonas]